ncbi:ABC transporter permease [Arthrobacter zhaoguopingii]|uniref:ABC transporter permease n=1 Tax=Arthrobacter zhaoguopingii TaxID=2681491 RepID=UPI00135CE439|nr:ABC transporter permease [Arthrobacter zhaoguopingii]
MTFEGSVSAAKNPEADAPAAGKPPRPAFLPILAATILLLVLSAVLAPQTVSAISLLSMLPFAAVLAVAAVGSTFVVQQRGIDLSVGGTISVAAVSVSVLPARYGLPVPLVIIITLVICAVIGLVNSLLVLRLSITSLVATLAVNALLIGAVTAFTRGSPATAPEGLTAVVTADILGVPLLVWFAAVVILILAAVSSGTVAGRRFVLAGANPAAATVSSIRVSRYVALGYVCGALCYGVAGILLAGFLRNTTVNVGNSYLVAVIAAVIVGGTPLSGGRGTVIGSAIAALFLSHLVQVVLTLGAPTSSQLLIQAGAIAVATVLGAFSWRDIRNRPRRRPTAHGLVSANDAALERRAPIT